MTELCDVGRALHESAEQIAWLNTRLGWQGELAVAVQQELQRVVTRAEELVAILYRV